MDLSKPLIGVLIVLLANLTNALPNDRPNVVQSYANEVVNDGGTKWAVLFAGSKGFDNYRHQADICHAYQLLKAGGLKDENIIVFMYDDIAYHRDNVRHMGKIFNKPNGPDVYKGVLKDYVGRQVTAENLYAVLKGDKETVKGRGSGKVLNSGPNDLVFFYFADHGDQGILGSPDEKYITAPELNAAFMDMHKRNAYAKMIVYIEACMAGSMFQDILPANIHLLATTASNEEESSYGWYCPGQRGGSYGVPSCLGDLFSISWMEDAEAQNRMNETILDQLEHVTKRVTLSHVQTYGDKTFEQDSVAEFEGAAKKKSANVEEKQPEVHEEPTIQMYNQHDADLLYYWTKYIQTSGSDEGERFEALKELHHVIAHRVHIDTNIHKLLTLSLGRSTANKMIEGKIKSPRVVDWDWPCIRSLVRRFESKCGSLHEWGMRHLGKLALTCSQVSTKALNYIEQICHPDDIQKGNKWMTLERGFSL